MIKLDFGFTRSKKIRNIHADMMKSCKVHIPVDIKTERIG